MESIGMVLLVVGLIAALIGGIQFLIITFQEHVLWAIGFFIFPVIGLVFLVLHWQKSHRAFLLYLGGMILLIAGAIMSGRMQSIPLTS